MLIVRLASATSGAGQVSVSAEMPIRITHDLAAEFSFRVFASQIIRGILLRLHPSATQAVRPHPGRHYQLIARPTSFSAAAGTTRSKLTSKDEIKWQELLSRTSPSQIYLPQSHVQTSGRFKPGTKRLDDSFIPARLDRILPYISHRHPKHTTRLHRWLAFRAARKCQRLGPSRRSRAV